jgi:NADH:ubiquinone oxidoreductase subunit 6 (subunit J)
VMLGSQFSGAQNLAEKAFGDPRTLAQILFHDFLLPFEITSVLIMIAILGAVVLASRPEAVAKRHPSEKPKSVPELVGTGKER